MRRLLFLLPCLFAAACSEIVPCARSEDTTTELLAGEPTATLTCGGSANALVLHQPSVRWSATRNFFSVILDYYESADPPEGAVPALTVAVNIPTDLPAGPHRADQSFETSTSSVPLVAVGNSRYTVTGTVDYKRSANYPFVDVREPPPATYTPTMELRLELSGSAFQLCDGAYVLEPVTLQLTNTLQVESCELGLTGEVTR